MQKQEQYKNIFKFFASLVIWLVQVGVWAYFWIFEYSTLIPRPFYWKGHTLVVVVYGIILLFFMSLYGAYRVGYYRRGDVVLSGAISITFVNLITYLQTSLIGADMMEFSPIVWMTIIDILLFWLWSFIAYRLYSRYFPPHQMLMVYGDNESTVTLVNKMLGRSEKFKIQEIISINIAESQLKEKISGFSAVVLCDIPVNLRNRLVDFCFEKGIRTYTVPKISDILIRSAESITLFDTPLLLNRNQGLTFEQRLLKRAVDILLSAVFLLVFSPLMVLIALAVKLQDGGPVFYKQERLTQNGRVFLLYKFRSMIVDAEKENGAQLAAQNDDRITPLGRILRKIRFDEFPQMLNILVGDMSLVGPRPERPEIAEKYSAELPEFDYRLKVRAGLTGYAQVVGKYNTTPYDKLKMDIVYIAGYSLVMDFKILFLTLRTLFQKEATDGVTE